MENTKLNHNKPGTLKLYTKTFGCQMNVADSDEMGRHLKARGFTPTDSEDEADAVLVNTCTVRDLAEHKASSYLGTLKEWKDLNPARLIIVTGCAAERAGDVWEKRFPHVDLIVGAKDIERFPTEFDMFFEDRIQTVRPEAAGIENRMEGLNSGGLRPGNVIQYVTIMRGCNYNCTYCIVPSVRGREIYRPIEEILTEVKTRVAEGAKEIWLLGQTVNSYKPASAPHDDYDFSDLLRDVNKIEGLERIRFMSPHPYYVTPKLIQAMVDCEKVCEQLHLPVQSGSNKILKAMKRNYTREGYLTSVTALRSRLPHISITTDIIVGFPGETEADFEETLRLLDEAQFDSAYCFKYSPRPGTPATEMADDVPLSVKEERIGRLLERVEKQGQIVAQTLVGSTQEMLVEEDKGDGVFRGMTRGSWKVRVKDAGFSVGTLAKVKITGTHSRELHAEPIL